MLRKVFTLSTEGIGKETAYYTVGFVTVSADGDIEEASCAGSGTLVTVGSLHGILTAAHVLEALPKTGQIGLVVEIDDPTKYQKQLINMEHTDSVLLCDEPFDQYGRDLAFLRLPQEGIGWLKAQRSFYNLFRPREDVLAIKEPSKSYVDILIGMIHALTEDVPSEKPKTRKQRFTAIFCGAKLTAMRYLADYDLYYFEPTGDAGFSLPESFEGTSGGAVWRFYVEEKNGETPVIDRRIVGVPFFQMRYKDKPVEIVCHGSKSIYGPLIDKIKQKWPEETK